MGAAVGHGLLGHLVSRQRAVWRGTAAAVTIGCVALGVLPAAPASAAEGSRPIGAITSVVDDADIWGDDGPVGGLSVTGWMTDADLGDQAAEIRVAAGDTVRSAWVWSDRDQWQIGLPLPAGEHMVCATVVDTGSGDDAELGCVTATVPEYSPSATTQSFTVEAVVGQDWDVSVVRVEQPVLHVRACLDPATTTVDTTDLGLVIDLDAFDGQEKVSDVLHPAPFDVDGLRCVEAAWQVDAPLVAGTAYWAYARLVLGDLSPSAETGGDVGVMYSPLGVAPVKPADGGVLVEPSSVLTVCAEGDSTPVDVEFAVTSVASGSVVAEG
ncbi:MAG TPA: hypothetical protein VGC37_09575, partial [Friedmanniella sp.]